MKSAWFRFQKGGFTFIEILITLAVVAICFLPLMRMFAVGLEQVNELNDISTARYLAQLGMEKVKNLGFTQAQLEEIGDVWEPDINSPPFLINGKQWRIQRKILRGTDPLEIHILVYEVNDKPSHNQNEAIVDLVVLTEDIDWSPAS